jgi:hypothetical protein
MLFHERDGQIIRAFVEREANQFLWDPATPLAKAMFISRMRDLIYSYEESVRPMGGVNFVRIQSLTNMGLVEAELVLTPALWKSTGGVLELYLPNSPRGGVGHSFKPKY